MRRLIDIQRLKELVEQGKSYREISKIMSFTEDSLCRCYTKNFGIRKDRAASYRQKIDISYEQLQVLFGSLLGDMNLTVHAKTVRGTETHSVKQAEYVFYKHTLLDGLCGKILKAKTIINKVEYHKLTFVIRPNTNLWDMYYLFYGTNNKKDVPFDLNLLAPLAIAMWFMDDGFVAKTHSGQNLGFSTCSFSFDGLGRLQNYLLKEYGIETIIRKNNYLIVRTNSCFKLSRLIKQYMIPSMYYKLGKYIGC